MAESDSPPAQPAQTAHPTNQMDQLSGQDVEGQPLEPQQIGDSGALDIPNRREDKSFLASPSTQLDIGKSEAKGGLPDNSIELKEGDSTAVSLNIMPESSISQQLDLLSNRVAQLEDPENIVTQQLKLLSGRIAKLEDNKGAEDDKTGQDSPEDILAPRMLKTVPEVRYCNWQQFKNRLGGTEEEYGIEVLNVGDDFGDQIQFEQLSRLSHGKRRPKHFLRHMQKLRKQIGGLTKTGTERMERVRINSATVLHFLSEVSGQIWSRRPHTFLKPFKILIHFHEKMEEHFRVLEETFGPTGQASAPAIHHSHELHDTKHIESQDTTRDLPVGLGLSEVTVDGPSVPNANLIHQQGIASIEKRHEDTRDYEGLEAITNSEKAYRDMKCYVEFVRTRLLPLYQKFDNADSSNPTKIRYDELWYLFRYNELVYQRSDPKNEARSTLHHGSSGPRAGTTSPKLWRVHNIWQNAFEFRMPNFADGLDQDIASQHILNTVSDSESDSDDENDHQMLLNCHYIDYDGDSYSAVVKTFSIRRYDGERDIHRLPIYPLRFAKDREAICNRLQKRGRKFQEVISNRQQAMSYDGWTLIRDPSGDLIKENWDNPGGPPRIQFPHHVDSDVIIDTHEAFQNHPWWKPVFQKFPKDSFAPETRFDVIPIIRWVDSTRTQIIDQTTEAIISKDRIEDLEWNIFAENDRFIFDPDDGGDDIERTKQVLSEEDLMLLPGRVFAFSLRDRKFFNADVSCLSSIPVSDDPFDSLEINKQHKRMILSNVYEHFERKRIQQLETSTKDSFNQDFIRGKGRGLVILLHGAPGVGKTATAEAVAYTQKRPLFPITCGDLGTTPDVVESKLSQIFRLADLWDCVLLLDEAEIFLSQRRKNDDNIKRNAMVSIFLRTLEYYPGILFLTTNRPGALDDAVKSRVHVSLNYPSLGHEETIALFQTNIARLRKIEEERARAAGGEVMKIKDSELLAFATDHWYHDPNTRWNGRQIRNAFQIAASLAHYKKSKAVESSDCYIGREHFQEVATMTIDYDLYRRDMFGKEEDELAAKREERRNRPLEEPRKMGERHGQGGSQYRTPPSSSHRSAAALSRSWTAASSSQGYQETAKNPGSSPSTPLVRQQLTPSSSYGTQHSYDETDRGDRGERSQRRTGGSRYRLEESDRRYRPSEEQPEFGYEQAPEPAEGGSPNWRSQY